MDRNRYRLVDLLKSIHLRTLISLIIWAASYSEVLRRKGSATSAPRPLTLLLNHKGCELLLRAP